MGKEFLRGVTDDVQMPSYDRARVTPGIVHFGVGGFHRAHQALVVDRILEQGLADDWGICGVGVLPGDRAMQRVLEDQDCLYTLVEKDADGTRTARVIGAIVEYLFAPDDPEAVIERMADPGTRIVSLTVTEGGYQISPVTGEFELAAPGVAADLQSGAVPATVFGLVTEALRRRRERGTPPFTVMSCDNILGNGSVARQAFSAFADAKDPDLGAWIRVQVAFPNSMVDRITPVTTDVDRAEILDQFGVADGWPVVAEPFFQWVLEDDFSSGRPPFDAGGVQLVEDVTPYELMKLRLLNASHQGIAYFGYLMGYRYVHDAVDDETMARFLLDYMRSEAIPTLLPVPGIDLQDYTETLIKRFRNAGVKDTIARLCADSSDRIPTWLVPVIKENLAAGRPVRLSAAIVASWARYAEGIDEAGEPINIVDRLAESLTETARTQHHDPVAFVRNRELFGDLIDDQRFVDEYRATLASLRDQGAARTLADLSR
jgi:mannitol 2-dehydrogenase